MVPANFGEIAAPVRGAVELVELVRAVHLRDQNSGRLARDRIEQKGARPSGDRLKVLRPAGNHRLQLGDLLLRQWLFMVNLRKQRRITGDFVDTALAPSADLLAQVDRPADGVKQHCRVELGGRLFYHHPTDSKRNRNSKSGAGLRSNGRRPPWNAVRGKAVR